ncbi:MAG: thiamine transport system permease protein [Chloroflexota bacterium]|nr:thiamine transport system permease protein [Chloroflexota bacterium]
MPSKRWNVGRLVLWLLPLGFLLAFYFFPLGKIVTLSLARWRQDGLAGWDWGLVRRTAGFTFYQATLSTLLTLVLGLPAAFLLSRFQFRGKGFLRVASTLPFILPTVVVAAAFNALVGPHGWLNQALMALFNLEQAPIVLQNSLAAILVAHVFYNTSIVIRVVSTAWEGVDLRLENAARTLGASPARVFWNVTLPLLRPALISAFLLVFLFDFTSFGVILMMGGPQFSTLEVEIYIQTMQFLNLPLAGLLSLIQLVFCMAITAVLIASGRSLSVPVMPRVKQENLRRPKKAADRIFVVLMSTVLILLLVLPLVALVGQAFFSTSGGTLHPTLQYFRQLFINPRESIFYVPPIAALRNSLLYALTASALALGLGMLLANAARTNRLLSRLLNWLVLLPLGTSAVTFGLGLYLAYGTGYGALRWYPLLIPLAHALIALPFVLNLIEPALDAIPANLKWAARTLGASPRTVWRRVELPIIWRAALTAFVYAYAISLGEFGATSFLTRPDIPTLPIAVYRYLTMPGALNYGQAMAMSVVLLAVCALSMFLVDRLQLPAWQDKSRKAHPNA